MANRGDGRGRRNGSTASRLLPGVADRASLAGATGAQPPPPRARGARRVRLALQRAGGPPELAGLLLARGDALAFARGLARIAARIGDRPPRGTACPHRPARAAPLQQGGVTDRYLGRRSEEFFGLREYRPAIRCARALKATARARTRSSRNTRTSFSSAHAIIPTPAGRAARTRHQRRFAVAAILRLRHDTRECMLDLRSSAARSAPTRCRDRCT